jgi:hypothetical protein
VSVEKMRLRQNLGSRVRAARVKTGQKGIAGGDSKMGRQDRVQEGEGIDPMYPFKRGKGYMTSELMVSMERHVSF